jgi:hypothetical protein
MLEFCDERIRTIILFLASTGVRIRAIIAPAVFLIVYCVIS